jgi:hypothetical protein
MMKPPQTLAKFSHDATSPEACWKVSLAGVDTSKGKAGITPYFRIAVENV